MDTVYSQEEIIESLKVIKEICQKTERCKECPFCTLGPFTDCYINERKPEEWEIIDLKNHGWRAFQ